MEPRHRKGSLMPEPSADHSLPLHFAILLADRPPATVNLPPANKFPRPSAARALTQSFPPDPKASHSLPLHFAMLVAETPPVLVNTPPVYRLPHAYPVAC